MSRAEQQQAQAQEMDGCQSPVQSKSPMRLPTTGGSIDLTHVLSRVARSMGFDRVYATLVPRDTKDKTACANASDLKQPDN